MKVKCGGREELLGTPALSAQEGRVLPFICVRDIPKGFRKRTVSQTIDSLGRARRWLGWVILLPSHDPFTPGCWIFDVDVPLIVDKAGLTFRCTMRRYGGEPLLLRG